MSSLVKSVPSKEHECPFISFGRHTFIVYRSSVEGIVSFNHDLFILQRHIGTQTW